MPESPPLVAELVWAEGLRFDATVRTNRLIVDGDGLAGPSPMQALAIGIAGCMGADVVAILQKGRHALEGLRVVMSATRAETHPKRFTHIHLAFHVKGALGQEPLDRAIALSKDEYCSALLSLREDIGIEVSTRIDA